MDQQTETTVFWDQNKKKKFISTGVHKCVPSRATVEKSK